MYHFLLVLTYLGHVSTGSFLFDNVEVAYHTPLPLLRSSNSDSSISRVLQASTKTAYTDVSIGCQGTNQYHQPARALSYYPKGYNMFVETVWNGYVPNIIYPPDITISPPIYQEHIDEPPGGEQK